MKKFNKLSVFKDDVVNSLNSWSDGIFSLKMGPRSIILTTVKI